MDKEDKAYTDYQERFHELYDGANYTSFLQKWVMDESHKFLEKTIDSSHEFQRVLEIGAGTGEHLFSIKHQYDEYILLDSNQKVLNIAKNKHLQNKKIKYEVHSGKALDYPDASFDRVIAVHVLEHIYEPHLAIKEWCRVIKDGGLLSILIPTDPGLLWRMGRNFGPRKKAQEKGIPYDYIMAREHVNSCNNLVSILRYYFPSAHDEWWPFGLPLMDVNLFYSFNAKVNDKQCK